MERQLIVELIGDYSKLKENIEQARKESLIQAKQWEKDFKRTLNLDVGVNHKNLYDLNKHLDLKLQHVRQIQREFDAKPLTVKVNTKELDELDERLKNLKSGKIDVNVNVTQSTNRGNQSSGVSGGRDTNREVVRSIESLQKTVQSSSKKSFSQAIGTGIAEEFGSTISRNLMSGFKKNLGLDIGGMTQSFTKAVSKPLAKVNPKSIQEFEDKIVSALEEAFVFKNQAQAEEKFKAAFQPIVDEIQEIAYTALGGVVKVAAQPLRIRKRVLLAQSMQQAQAMSESIKVDDNEEIKKAKSISLITGGIDYQKGGANTYFAQNLVKRVLPGSYSVPVTNPYSNDPNNLGFLYNQMKGMTGQKEGGKPMPLDMLFHTNIEKGYNPDSVKMAAEAMAYRKAHPDKPLILGGTSGGSYVVEEAIAILERAGVKNVKGAGITAPFAGLMQTASPANFQGNVGDLDPLYLAMFGGKHVADPSNPWYKKQMAGIPSKMPGLITPGDLNKVVPNAGMGHHLAGFLTEPEFQTNLQSFLGDSIDQIPSEFSGDAGKKNLAFFASMQGESKTIPRTLKAIFGDGATRNQIRANGAEGDEGYAFFNPDQPGWRRDNDFNSMMQGVAKKGKSTTGQGNEAFVQYQSFLVSMSEGLKEFYESGAKNKQQLLSSLDKAVELYPELKTVQKRVMETLGEQARLIDLSKAPASKDTRTAQEKYKDAARLARINAQFPKGQQYLKDKRNAELDAALPEPAQKGLGVARDIAKNFNQSFADLKKLVDEGLVDEAVNLARTIKESAQAAKAEITNITKSISGNTTTTRLGSQLGQTKGQVSSVEKKTDQLLARNKLSIPKDVVAKATDDATKAGQNIAEGFSQGMGQKLQDLREISKELAQIPVEITKEELDIQSPSKVMEQLGKWTAEGFVKGLETLESLNLPDIFKNIISEAKDLFSSFVTGASSVSEFLSKITAISTVAKLAVAAFAGFVIFQTFGKQMLDFAGVSIEVATNLENIERRIKFVSGGALEGAKNLAFLRSEAKRLNVDLSQTLSSGASFLQATQGTPLEGDPSRQVISAVTQASSVYGLDQQQQERSFTALEQIAGKTVVSQEELRQQLAEALPNASQVAARAYNTTAQSMNQLLKSGRALAEDFLPKFSQQLLAETSSGVAEASNSSIAILNKYNNALLEFEEAIGKALLPFRNFSLGSLATSLDFIVKNGGIARNIFLVIVGVLTKPIWSAFGLYIKTLALDFVALARTGSLSFATLGSAALGFSKTLLTFGKQLLIFTAIAEGINLVRIAFSDLSGDVGRQIKDQTNALNEYKKALGESVTPPRSNGETLGNRYKDVFNFASEIKTINDTLKAVGQSNNNTGFLLQFADSDKIAKSTKQVKDLDKALEQVQMKRRSLIQKDPQNFAGLRDLDNQQKQILEQRQKALTPVAGLRKSLDTQAENIKAQIDYFKELRGSQFLYKKDIDDLNQVISSLEGSLGTVIKKQDELRKSVKDTLTELQLFEIQWQDIGSAFDDTRTRLDFLLDTFKFNSLNQESLGNLTPGQVDFTNNLKAQETLSSKIAANFQEIKQKLASLDVAGLDQVLAAVGLNKGSGIADIRKEEARALDGTKEQLILKNYGDLRELVQTTNGLQIQLAEQRSATTRQIYDSNKSVADYLEAIQREAQELQITAKDAAQQIKSNQAKSKLKSALLGFQENFVGQFVDSLIGVIDTLNQPLQESIQLQSQILQNANKYKDLIKQGTDIQRGLPQQFMGGGSASSSTGITFPIPGVSAGGARMSSPYGWRKDPQTGQRTFHDGVDYAYSKGTPVVSPLAGVVTGVKYQAGGAGKSVEITSLDSQGRKIKQTFMHLDSQLVREGMQVAQGQQIGTVGSTGKSTGPHLHYRTNVNGQSVDPRQFLSSMSNISIPGSNSQSSALTKYGHFAYLEARRADLVKVGSELLDKEAAEAFNRMAQDAKKSGVNLSVLSGFRSVKDQANVFYSGMKQRGQTEEQRAKVSAPPGYSQHQTGMALDVNSVNPSFANSAAFRWMQQNAAKYGFKMPFTQGNGQGIDYEPWHWNYQGSDRARAMLRPLTQNPTGWMKTMASTYGAGDGFDGKPTASGERFNQNALTAAINERLKKQLGLNWGDKIEALNPANGKTVTVRITDSGPYEKQGGRYVPHSTRGLDLSTAAAKQIGISLGEVQFRVLGKNSQVNQNSNLVSNLRSPVSFGVGPVPFNNDAQAGLVAGAAQAAQNLQIQNEIIKAKFQGTNGLAQLEAQLQQQRANFQLRDSSRDMDQEVLKFQRGREDQSDSLGFSTPQKELEIKIRSLRRTLNDGDLELIKSQERLSAVVGTTEATLATLRTINQNDLPPGFDKEGAIAKLSELLPSAKNALSKVSSLLTTSATEYQKQVDDALTKFAIEEQARFEQAKVEIRNARIARTRDRGARAKLFSDRQLPGSYANGDPLLYDQAASEMEITGKYADTIRGLDTDLLTGEAAKKYGDSAAKMIGFLKKAALTELLRGLDTLRIQGVRDLQDRALAEKEENLNIQDTLMQSRTGLMSAKADGYRAYGLDTFAREFDRQNAIVNQEQDYQKQSLEIDKLANSGRYATEYIQELRDNLSELNKIKLENIGIEFNDFSEAIKGIKSDTQNVFKDFILNTEDVGSSISKIFQSILSNLAQMASQMLSDQLFGSIFGKNPLPGQTPSFGGGGGFSGILGGILGGIGSLGGSTYGVETLGGDVLNFAAGGAINAALNRERMQSGGRNPVLVVANADEVILNPQEAKIWNRLQNAGRISNYADGGSFGGSSAGGMGAMGRSGDTISVTVPISVSGTGAEDYDLDRLSRVVEAKIQATLKQERKPGGSLTRKDLYGR